MQKVTIKGAARNRKTKSINHIVREKERGGEQKQRNYEAIITKII